MPRWKFWQRHEEPPEQTAPPRTATIGQPVPRPPKPRSRPSPPLPTDSDTRERKRAQLLRRRTAVLYDVEQGELALQADNPWRERVALLAEAIAAVEADRAALKAAPPAPTAPVPPTPIEEIDAIGGDQATVRFAIDGETFRFEEEVDWDQRGGPLVRGELRQRSGDAANLVPAATPPDLREAFAAHLAASATVFATDLRDRALDGAPLPEGPTLADLARPCPVCGGWLDWRGHCAECSRRAWRRQELDAEAERLMTEQTHAEEERHRWADRLPIARRRLAVVDADLAALGGA